MNYQSHNAQYNFLNYHPSFIDLSLDLGLIVKLKAHEKLKWKHHVDTLTLLSHQVTISKEPYFELESYHYKENKHLLKVTDILSAEVHILKLQNEKLFRTMIEEIVQKNQSSFSSGRYGLINQLIYCEATVFDLAGTEVKKESLKQTLVGFRLYEFQIKRPFFSKTKCTIEWIF